jgi:hypothetical protein
VLTSAILQSDGRATRIGAKSFFALLLIVSAAVGFIPVALFIDRPAWIAIVAALALLVAVIYAVKLRADARSLTVLEAVASGIGGLFFSSTMGMMLLIWYLLISKVGAPLLGLILGLIGLTIDPDTAGRWVIAVFGVAFVPSAASIIADYLRDKLFPRTGVGNAPLFPGLTWPKFLRAAVPALLGGLVLLAMPYVGLLSWSSGYAVLQFYILIVCSPLSPRQKPAEEPPAVSRAVQKLLRASGYHVLERLQTHEPDLDRLIAVFDLVARAGSNVLAIQFKTGNESSPAVTWTEAASLRTATLAIYKAVQLFDVPVRIVRPVLILAGRKADETLKTFCEQQSIHLVEIEDAKEIDDIVADKLSDEELRARARSILRLRVPSGTITAQAEREPG